MDCPPPTPIAIHAELTAYTPWSTRSQTTGTTADGTSTARRPYGVAAERSIPFGSTIFIPTGHGYLDRSHAFQRGFTVDDRGGGLDTESRAINGGSGCNVQSAAGTPAKSHVYRLDFRVIDEKYAIKLGRQRMIVYIIYPKDAVNVPPTN